MDKNNEALLTSVKETVSKSFNDFMETSLVPTMEEVSVKAARKEVERMQIERFVRGRDVSGLGDEQKKAFAKQVQSVFRGDREGA